MIDLPEWPVVLRDKAIELQSRLFRHGPISTTVQVMSATERSELRQELLDFVAIAEQLNEAAEMKIATA